MSENSIRIDPDSSVHYVMSWASVEERASILARMRLLLRQTMNFRTSSSAQMLLLKDGDRVVAWSGVDAAGQPPEIFSQFVEQQYRGRRLGRLMEAARLAYLARYQVFEAYCRMDAAGTEAALRYRLQRSGWRLAADSPEVRHYAGQCRQCELFGDPCREQRYFVVDVQRALTSLDERVGRVPVDDLPLRVIGGARPDLQEHEADSGQIHRPGFTFERGTR